MPGSDECCKPSTVVVKLGGSVLTGEGAFARAARFLRDRVHTSPEERCVAVVSAQEGWTDSLERAARGITRAPSARSLDLLWSIGEIRSVALLTLHLEALGVRAAALNVAETGLRIDDARLGQVALDTRRLHATLAEYQIAVVPGFLGTNPGGTLVTLGRGGSDLTAVLLAAGLCATRCELVKDVPGYFSADPRRDRAARHLPALTFAEALELADHGCDLVQRQAIEAAANSRLPLVVRSLTGSALITLVSEAVPQLAQAEPQPLSPHYLPAGA